MSELISGKEALIALANGFDVLWRSPDWSGDSWHSLLTGLSLTAEEIFTETHHREDTGSDQKVIFKIKPRTITINGIEVPAPFEPKDGELYWHVFPACAIGYKSKLYQTTHVSNQMGAWRTESDIKKVVAALREVFK